MYKLFVVVLPEARTELSAWRARARLIPDQSLRHEALDSLSHKRFHADGGCVYAAFDTKYTKPLVSVIIALQTISDYLDNLCDRTGTFDLTDFIQLHHAMRDAVRPNALPRDYYEYRNHADDNGYLLSLVETCQSILKTFPGYNQVHEHVEWLVERYCELQAYKHTIPEKRSELLQTWAAPYKADFPELSWWEFSAACGSTLGMFALIQSSTKPIMKDAAKTIFNAYFPWICGLHILLDYLIDLDEDNREGDFNFIQCYPSIVVARQRLRTILQQSRSAAASLQDGTPIHRFVVKGLLGMYLSDRKAAHQQLVRRARSLVWTCGPTAWLFYLACILYRIVR